jgi:hypothetical protein
MSRARVQFFSVSLDGFGRGMVPILLGRGVRDVESIASPSGVVHLSFTRRHQAAGSDAR